MPRHSFGIIVLSAALLTAMLPSLLLLPNIVDSSAAAEEISASSASEVHSDFNGDGENDLAIEVPFEDVGSVSAAGAVNVLYGASPSGLQTSSPPDQFWHQNSPGVEDASEPDDQFGSALTAGDFNGDGFGDLAIAVPREHVGSVTEAGAVHVLYGSSSGLQTAIPADQFWHQNSPGVEDSVEGGELFGSSLVSGDFNGDGFDDVAVGSMFENISGKLSAGGVNVLYGSSLGLQTTSPADQFWHQDKPGVEDTAENQEFFGAALTSGDFNGDGKDDLAIGVPGEDPGNTTEGGDDGAVNVLYGSSSGLQTTSPADQIWTQDSPGVEETAEGVGDIFGGAIGAGAIGAGDFNGDGFSDLAVGIPGETVGALDAAGSVTILYGSSAGLRSTAAGDGTGRTDQLWTQNSQGLNEQAEAFDNFGFQFGIGDFNGDGFDDLAIGVPFENVGTTRDAGAVNVLYGSTVGLQATGAPDDQRWHQDSPGVEDFNENDDRFSMSLFSADFNGDGYDDLTIGVPEENVGGVKDAGAVNVLYGSAFGLQTTSPADQFWHQNSPGIQDSPEDNDNFGAAFSLV